MKHHVTQRKFGRKKSVRTALIRSLLHNIIRDEAIVTTEAKAKEIRPLIEKMITRAKTDNVANRRIISSRLFNNKDITKKLFEEIAPQYADRPGGYTRITKLPQRGHDAAKMAHITFVK